MCPNRFILLMGLPYNTRITKMCPTYVIICLIMGLKLNGTSSQLITVRACVMESGVLSKDSFPEQASKWYLESASPTHFKCLSGFGIKFFHITTTEAQAHTELFKLEERYKLSQTLPGTRSFHTFIPFGVSNLGVYRIYFDEHYLTHKYGAKTASSILHVAPGQFHACIYDGNWCIGTVTEVLHENKYVYFHFMRRSGINNL